jgi:hypothetical protein
MVHDKERRGSTELRSWAAIHQDIHWQPLWYAKSRSDSHQGTSPQSNNGAGPDKFNGRLEELFPAGLKVPRGNRRAHASRLHTKDCIGAEGRVVRNSRLWRTCRDAGFLKQLRQSQVGRHALPGPASQPDEGFDVRKVLRHYKDRRIEAALPSSIRADLIGI